MCLSSGASFYIVRRQGEHYFEEEYDARRQARRHRFSFSSTSDWPWQDGTRLQI